jgi:hypothetical protein
LWILELATHTAPALVVLALSRDLRAAGVVGLAAAFVGLLQVHNARRAAIALRAEDATRRSDAHAARAPLDALAHREIGRAVERLECTRDEPDARRALDEFAERVSCLIAVFERAASAEQPAA